MRYWQWLLDSRLRLWEFAKVFEDSQEFLDPTKVATLTHRYPQMMRLQRLIASF